MIIEFIRKLFGTGAASQTAGEAKKYASSSIIMKTPVLLAALAALSPVIASAQLQLYLPFDTSLTDGFGNLISPDASGFGRDASLNLAAVNPAYGISGATIVPDARAGGGALQLDGVKDFARVLGWSGISGNEARTVSLWVKEPASSASPNDVWVGWGDPGGGARVRWDFALANSSASGMRLELNSGSAQSIGATVADDSWHMVTATYAAAGTGVSFYLDGNPYGTATFSANPVNTDTSGSLGVVIGTGIREASAFNGNPARFVGGLIDDVRIYDTELDAAAVQNLYATTVPEPSSAALCGLGAIAFCFHRARKARSHLQGS